MSHCPRAVSACQPSGLGVKSPWQTKDKYIAIEENEILDAGLENNSRAMFHFAKCLRGRSSLFILLLLGILGGYTQYFGQKVEQGSVRETMMEEPVGEFDALSQPEFMDLVLVQRLDQSLLPNTGKYRGRGGRLVIVGDVHGMKNELVKLLEEVHFDKKKDHLILTGDMISKGPDSRGVLDLIMELGATAVRGNHEDRVLLAHAGFHSRNDSSETDEGLKKIEEGLVNAKSVSRKGEHRDRVLAKQLSRKQIRWLKKCPVILSVGNIAGMGQVLVVHAGLVPGVKLHAQDPFSVMNMRSIDSKTHVPSDGREGTEWTKLWNHYQSGLESQQTSTVIYGHDSRRGLQIKQYSKGLDTGCLRGGQLTALVIEGGHWGAKQKLVHVDCADGRS